jgi:hypothetical protein
MVDKLIIITLLVMLLVHCCFFFFLIDLIYLDMMNFSLYSAAA